MSEELKQKNDNIEKELLSKVLRRMSDDFKNGNYDTEIVISLEELLWEEIDFELENLEDKELLCLSKFSKLEEIGERATSLFDYRMDCVNSRSLLDHTNGYKSSPILEEADRTFGNDWQERLHSNDKDDISQSEGMKL